MRTPTNQEQNQSSMMIDLNYVLKRIEAGAKVRFYEDFYGKQWIEIQRAWLLGRRKRVQLPNEQIIEVKSALRRRRAKAEGRGNTRH